MKYTKHLLDLHIAKAKAAGDSIWMACKTFASSTENSRNYRLVAYVRFAKMCRAFGETCFEKDPTAGQLFSIEMILRAGKSMSPQIKLAYRKQADKLYEQILLRDKTLCLVQPKNPSLPNT